MPPSLDEESKGFFESTEGRWLYNETLRKSETRRVFDVAGLKQLAAASVGQSAENVTLVAKLVESCYSRSFLITMRSGLQLVARIPFLNTQPTNLVIASEVATMDFLRLHGIPVPYVYAYSTTAENAAGTEYILMQYMAGTNLGNIWDTMSDEDRIIMIRKLVELETRLFALRLPASGSLYYIKDLPASLKKVDVPTRESTPPERRFCIGPDTTPGLWHGKRLGLEVDRGPFTNPIAAVTAGAKKEIAYLRKFGKPLHPLHRQRRKIYNYQKQSHLDYLDSLDQFLRIAPYLVPDELLTQPTIRHPNPQPHHVFVDKHLEITGLVGWQHCRVLPLFLQPGIPSGFPGWGDTTPRLLHTRRLPDDIDDLHEREQLRQRARALHLGQMYYHYLERTLELNWELHNALLRDAHFLDYIVWWRMVYDNASEPWEGDNVPLKADLTFAAERWSTITRNSRLTSRGGGESPPPCPIAFTNDEIGDCFYLYSALAGADKDFDAWKHFVGVTSHGYVSRGQYERVKQREEQLRVAVLDAAESDLERSKILEHWPFADFDEEEYL